jgi:hypothetical protein
MPRGNPKGSPKTPGSGRKKGSLNKNNLSLRETMAAFEEGKGFKPVEELMHLYTLIYADNPLVAVKILIALLDRIHPTLKAIEHTGEDGGPIAAKMELVITDYRSK